jgi:magnesium-transporting ATPase (P-type)
MIALQMRSDDVSFRKIGFLKNRPLILSIGLAATFHLGILYIPIFQTLFSTVALTLHEWSLALMPGAVIFVLESLRKEIFPNLFNSGKWG